jgi:hypothetical protein
MSRFLHVANGSSTTMTLQDAGIPGAVSIWADPLHDGPVPGGLSDNELLDLRVRHHAGFEPVDPANDMREWRAVLERHHAYDEVVLWFEHDLFDQLNLIQLLAWMHEHLPAATNVSLICIGSFPGRPRFMGLGELSAPELASLFPLRQRVTDAQIELAFRSWHAFREPTPEPMDALRQSDTTALPFLSAALTRFLQEYPWMDDGLSRTERRLLTLASREPIRLIDAFPRMHADETAYYVADTSLAELADTLSRTSPPLLIRSGDEGGLSGLVSLTPEGRAVLSGQKDRVSLCGIDRWFGGVHLRGRGDIWRWDDRRQQIAGPPDVRQLV